MGLFGFGSSDESNRDRSKSNNSNSSTYNRNSNSLNSQPNYNTHPNSSNTSQPNSDNYSTYQNTGSCSSQPQSNSLTYNHNSNGGNFQATTNTSHSHTNNNYSTYNHNNSSLSSQSNSYSKHDRLPSHQPTTPSYTSASKLHQSHSFSHQAPPSPALSTGQLDVLLEYEGKLRSAFDELSKAQQQINLTHSILESLVSSYSIFVRQFSPDVLPGNFPPRNDHFQQSNSYSTHTPFHHNPPPMTHHAPTNPPHNPPQTGYHDTSSMPYGAMRVANPHNPVHHHNPPPTYPQRPAPVVHHVPINQPYHHAPPAYQQSPPSVYHAAPTNAPLPPMGPVISTPQNPPPYQLAIDPTSTVSVQKVEPPVVPKESKPKRKFYIGLCSPSDSDIWENIRCLKSLESKIDSHFEDVNFVLTTEGRPEIDLFLYCIRADTRILIEEENPPVEKKNVVTVVFLNRTDRLGCNVSEYHSGIRLQSHDEKWYFFQFSYKGGEDIDGNKENLSDLENFVGMLKDFFNL